MKGVCALLIGIVVISGGCDLFKTRDPQSPNKPTSGFKPPVTPEMVLENFTAAIEAHNVDNYIRCFVDTSASAEEFQYYASVGYEIRLQNWTLDDERRCFQNIGAPISAVPYLNFIGLKELNRTSRGTEFTSEYVLFYPHQLPAIAREVRGFLHFYLNLDDQQRWAIYRWDDAKTVTDSTWSYLKYSFY